MEVPFAKNFKDYVALMAVNSPQALVMDWWRRLDLALREYVALRQVVDPRNRSAIEEAVSLDRALGPGFANCIRRLRLLRNQIAHRPIYHHSSEDAASYARHAFTLIAILGRRVSRLEREQPRNSNYIPAAAEAGTTPLPNKRIAFLWKPPRVS